MSDLLASTRCLANLPPIAPRWLWPQRIPQGKIILLAGPSGSGKTFIALDIAARISTNRPFPAATGASDPHLGLANSPAPKSACLPQSVTPDAPSVDISKSSPGSILLITPEEDLIDNIRPRLQAAQADVDKFTSTTELSMDQLKRCSESINDLKLIIIDPLSFLITNDQEPLSAAEKLFDLYQHVFGRSISILALLPMRPGRSDPLYRIPGINRLTHFASIIFAVSPDYREENTNPNRRVLIQLKNNLSPIAPALAFNLENCAVAWSAEILPDHSLPDILIPPHGTRGPDPVQQDRCVQWLYEFLAPQPLPQAQVVQASAAAGFSFRTLRRAKAELQVQSKRQKQGHWIWRVHPGILDYDNFDQMTDKILREAQLPGLDSMLNPPPP